MEDQTNFPIVVTDSYLESVFRSISEGWEAYTDIYRYLDKILLASPTFTFMGVPKVPTITLKQVIEHLTKQFIFDHDLLTESNIKLLVTIWSLRNQKVITSEFLLADERLPLLMTVLDENGAFDEDLE